MVIIMMAYNPSICYTQYYTLRTVRTKQTGGRFREPLKLRLGGAVFQSRCAGQCTWNSRDSDSRHSRSCPTWAFFCFLDPFNQERGRGEQHLLHDAAAIDLRWLPTSRQQRRQISSCRASARAAFRWV